MSGGNEDAEKLLKQINNEEKIAKTTSTKENEIVSGKKKFYDGTYVGKLLNGKPHGQGTYNYSNGNVYTGHWLNGKRNGWGEFKWSDGSRYIGHWSNNNFHGSGTLYNVDGSIRDTGDWEYGTLKKVKTKRTQSSINNNNMSRNNSNMLIIKGKVTDGKSPILLVNVLEKGTSNKTTTDYYGNFTLRVRKGSIIQFSDVRHRTIELKADSNMEVIMRRK